MSINKTTIRETIRSLLVDKTDCNENVYTSRPTPLWEPELPAICISIKTESLTKVSESPVKIFNRKPQIDIYIIAKANNHIEDVLDKIQHQVELILSYNEYLPTISTDEDCLKDGLEPLSTETDVVIDGKIPVGCNILKFTCSYEREWPYPQVLEATDDFITANTRFDINQDTIIDVNNTVTVRSGS